jgi:PAS domain S-box-containing protein
LHHYQARAYMSFGNLVIPWTRHIQTGRELVRRAFDAANKIGDLTFAAYSCNNLNTNILATGDPLGGAQHEAENGLDFAQKARFGIVIDIVTTQLGLIRTLRGLTPEFGTFNNEGFDESLFEQHLQSKPSLALPECWYWIRKLQARVYANDYTSALEAAAKARTLLWTSPSFFEMAEYHLYGALARAANHDKASSDARSQDLEALASHHKQLEEWAENCPENFENRAALVAAEIARIEGRPLDAMPLYERAIQSAHEHGFVQNEALACEVAARFYLTQGLTRIAHTYLHNARDCYDRWGALGKVRQLDQRYPHLREERAPTSTTSTIGTPVLQLDVETVVKASQALSSEMILPNLIEKLMRIAVEHAGAEGGLLILLRGDEPLIEAKATTGQGRVKVTVRQAAVTPADLPHSALHYVIRTQGRVVLDDASTEKLCAEDEYVRQKRARSILCLPIVKQTKLIGALYLENNLTPSAFTSDRVAVLELLASQAAISLENANLYSDLQRSEAFLAQGQNMSHTGSFGWKVSSGEIYWSEETRTIFEYKRAAKATLELVFQRIHPDDRDRVRQTTDRAAAAKSNLDLEYRLLMPDGLVKHVHISARALETSSGNFEYVGAVTDVTTARQAEATLRESEAYLAEAQRLSHTGSWAWNPATGENRYWSEECYRLLGFEPGGGLPPFETYFQRIHPDDQSRYAEKLERATRERAEFEVDYRIIHPNGEIRNVHAIGHPVLGPSGDLVEFVGTGIDVTERKQAEEERERLRQAHADLARVNRITTMGELTASLAHEVNQPIAAAVTDSKTCLRWLARDQPDLEEARAAAMRAVKDATRAAEIISRIRLLFNKGTPTRELCDVNELIGEMIVLLHVEAIRYNISVRTELATDLPRVMGDRVQLQQVLMNLMINGVEAMKEVDGPRELAIKSRLAENNEILVSVSDTGTGVLPQQEDQIFNAFFTTKLHGTGMGLRISRSIVESHGGRLRSANNSPRGATFSFTLPVKVELP